MDIAEFNMIRPQRDVKNDQVVRLTDTKVLIPVTDPAPVEPLVLSWETLSEEMFGDRGVNPLEGDGGVEDSSLLRRIYELVLQVDMYLSGREDSFTGEQVANTELKLRTKLRLDSLDWQAAYSVELDTTALYAVALLGYRTALVSELSEMAPDYDRAMKLTRLASVAALLELQRDTLKGLTRDQVLDRLNRRPLVLDGVTSVQLPSRAPKVELVREAKKADLYVVRREWAGYVAGEIANIRNVMAGETFRQRDHTTTEVETTTTTEVETRRQTETEEETKLASELTQEVNSQLGVTINGHAEASVEFKYPIATARISGGVYAGFSMQRSERQARKSAKEAVSRAVSRVDSRTRETRARRELMRTEQGYTYGLDNKDGGNVHGVYRWVDRIDTYQTFRFPDRLLLEFQIPDPAEFYRWRTQRAANTAADKPPDFSVVPNEISLDKPDELMDLAMKYRAMNLPAPPDEKVSVPRTIAVQPDSIPEDNLDHFNPPTGTTEVDIPIPGNYEAKTVKYEGRGYPIQAWWIEAPAGNHSFGYRSAFATVSIGSESTLYWNGGDTNTTYGSGSELGTVSEVQTRDEYGVSTLAIGKDGGGAITTTEQVPLDPPTRDLMKVRLSSSGLALCTLTVSVECELTEEAKQAWRLAVYDTLYSAWASWKRDYESSLVRNVFGSTAADAGSSLRNELTIREELKREAISWLLEESPFEGRPGRHSQTEEEREAGFPDVNFGKARNDATVIQFLEQAFEWNNMSWVFYPYYWAARTDWPDRTQLFANDPEFERFLRSGSARVILPARPGFDDAVNNWLATGVPFLSGRLPAADETLYIRIDTEIRELTAPREGGFAGDTWQSQVSTTMLYLEEKGDLPFINTHHQLPAPTGEWYKPNPIIKFA